MKKFILPLLASALFLFDACNSRPTSMGDTNTKNTNGINRDKKIAFMGIKLGTPNNNFESIIDSIDNLVPTDLPDLIRRLLLPSNSSLFDNPYENHVGTFFSSIIDGNNEKYSGWGIAISDGDSITKIHYIIHESLLIDSIFDGLKSLYVKQYGVPDDEYSKEDIAMTNIGCYWDFKHNQRIYLNKCDSHSGLTDIFQRVEIVYQDMNSIQRQEERAKKEREKERQDSIDAVKQEKIRNAQEKEGQQI